MKKGPSSLPAFLFSFELERLDLEIHTTYATATPRRAAAL
jgi:hypothetical protein